MTRRSKKDKKPSALRLLLASNVEVLRDERYSTLPNPTARNKQLAKDADVSPSQIERVIAGTLGTSVDVLEAMANALRVRPQDLLTPYFRQFQQADDQPTAAPANAVHDRPAAAWIRRQQGR